MYNKVLKKDNNFKLIFYVITCLFYLHIGFMGSTYVLFFYSLGISKFTTNLIISTFSITLFIAEIPTGAYADIFGKRKSLILSGIFLTLSMLLFTFGQSAIVFIISEVLMGCAFAFVSGALESWAIEKLKLKDKEIDKLFTEQNKYLNLVLILGGLLGGFASNYSLRYIWILSLATAIIYLILVLIFVKEEKIEISKNNMKFKKKFINGIMQIKTTTINIFGYLLKNKNIRNIIFYNCILEFSFSPIFIYWAPLLNEYSNSKIWVLGIVWVVIKISNMIGNEFLNRIITKKDLSRESILYVSTSLIGICIFIASLSKDFDIILIAFITFEILLGIVQPIQRSCINNYIDIEERATILSFESMSRSSFSYTSMIIMGYIADKLSMNITWIIVSIIMTVVASIYFFKLKYSHTKTK